MSDEIEDKEFFDRADAIIALANSQCDDFPIGKVSSSLLFAAARFNAFIVASSAKDLDQLKEEKEEAIKYFKQQYEKFLLKIWMNTLKTTGRIFRNRENKIN